MSYDGKRLEKIESETHKNNKNEEIRTCPKIVVQLAVTSEEGVVFNPVRSGTTWQWQW